MPLFTFNCLDVLVPHLAWHIPIHIITLSSSVSSLWNLPASLLPRGRSTFLFVTSCQELCVCACMSASSLSVYTCVCSLSGSGSVTLQFTYLFIYLSPFLDYKLLGNWETPYLSLFL